MTYPTINAESAQKLVNQMLGEIQNGEDPLSVCLIESDWVVSKSGAEYERLLMENCGKELRKKWNEKTGKIPVAQGYKLEAEMASEVHKTLSMLDMDLLEDEDFWRYLALFPFRWFLLAREPELQPQDFGGVSESVNEEGRVSRSKKSLITQLIYRTFLWGKIAFDPDSRDPYLRATVFEKIGGPSIDIWHSHLVRTQLGQLGKMPHAFIDSITESGLKPDRMKDPARDQEKLLARVKHNVLLDIYDYPKAKELAAEQLGKILG
jgi:hypothetical protein